MTLGENKKALFSPRTYLNEWLGALLNQQISYEKGLLRVIVQKKTLQTQIQKKPLFR